MKMADTTTDKVDNNRKNERLHEQHYPSEF